MAAPLIERCVFNLRNLTRVKSYVPLQRYCPNLADSVSLNAVWLCVLIRHPPWLRRAIQSSTEPQYSALSSNLLCSRCWHAAVATDTHCDLSLSHLWKCHWSVRLFSAKTHRSSMNGSSGDRTLRGRSTEPSASELVRSIAEISRRPALTRSLSGLYVYACSPATLHGSDGRSKVLPIQNKLR